MSLKDKFQELLNKLIHGTREVGSPRQFRRAMSKVDRSDTYKPRFSCGYRGFSRRLKEYHINRAAPTIDQVRRLERQYKTRLRVERGLMFFKADGKPFTHELAKQRCKEQLIEEI